MFANRRATTVAIVVAVLVVAVLVFLLTRGSGDPSVSAAPPGTGWHSTEAPTSDSSGAPGPEASSVPSTVDGGVPAPGADPGDGPDASPAPTDPAQPDDGGGLSGPVVTEPPPELPAVVSVTSTERVHDGQTVSIHVVPTSGGVVYGVEAWLCKAGSRILEDSDMRPTEAGNCIAGPLSPNSDQHTITAADPPYQFVDLDYRVGVGTSSFVTDDGVPVTITCGPGNPCILALKVQVEGGYGFKTYDVTYG